ncbi:hypothetical protein I2W78_24925 [Streptomyces spinoverrucosus]|uniref:hypothetical protein n=1 Tax=Streptomyces spinoverrucosus TaxID=284043 RepID=UPI0018C35D18|nr:hypothetical protein [Streptomyces spinoverrucosus]MBG0854998.1 hypothetical protein [Streptomyces spinoverrucosus]
MNDTARRAPAATPHPRRTEPVQLGTLVKFPDGWEANHAVLAHLAEHRVAWRP